MAIRKRFRIVLYLAKPGVKVITANPKTSGGALVELFGVVGCDRSKEVEMMRFSVNFVTQVYRNVAVLPKDALLSQ
jgi:ABC-type sulfate transport system substrate-binding protein